MKATRRRFLEYLGMGALATGGVLLNRVRAQDTCRRVSGGGSYLLGPYRGVGERAESVYLVTDLGFDETMLFCTVRTNYAAFQFPTATMAVVELNAHEFFMDMESVRINSVEVQDTDDGLQAVYSGILRSQTRLFSGDKMQTIDEGHVVFGCYTTMLDPRSNVYVTGMNFSMTASFDPKGGHAAIFGEEATFAGHLMRGNIVIS